MFIIAGRDLVSYVSDVCLSAELYVSIGWPTHTFFFCILRIQWKLVESRGWDGDFFTSRHKVVFFLLFCGGRKIENDRKRRGGLRQSASVPRWAARRTGWSVVNTHAAGHTKWNVNSLVNYHKQCSQTQNRGTHTECKTSDLLFHTPTPEYNCCWVQGRYLARRVVHVREFRSLLYTHKQVSDVIMQKKTHVHVSGFIFTQRDPCVTDDEVCSNIDYYFFIIVSGNHWLWVVSDGDGWGGLCCFMHLSLRANIRSGTICWFV